MNHTIFKILIIFFSIFKDSKLDKLIEIRKESDEPYLNYLKFKDLLMEDDLPNVNYY